MAPHYSTLAWKIPWTEEPGGLQSVGLLRVGHDWATSLSLFTFMHWRRNWQPTPVFLGFPCGSAGKESACNVRDLGSIPIPLEKEMATRSGILAWRIPWTQEPRGLQPMASQRVRHDWTTDTQRNLNLESESLALVLINDLQRVSLFELTWFLDLWKCYTNIT